jgi:cytochrome c peroxidase
MLSARRTPIILLLLVGLLLTAVALLARFQTQRTAAQQLRQLVLVGNHQPLAPPPAPPPALVALGETLFFDPELSGNRDVSCATCHSPDLGLSDGLPLAIGTGGRGQAPQRTLGHGRQFVPHNTPDLFNRGLLGWDTLFWDGRLSGTAATGFHSPAEAHLPTGLDNALAAQSLIALVSRHEMRGGVYNAEGYVLQPGQTPASYTDSEGIPQPTGWGDWDINGRPNELAEIGNTAADMPLVWQALMARLANQPGYAPLFAAAFPDTQPHQLTITHVANALAAYQTAAFVAADTPWDRYLAGDEAALSAEAKQGALLFFGSANCASCHSGSLFTDLQFHNIAAPQFGPGTDDIAPLDYGRYRVTLDPADKFAFRTPSLRQVGQTGPWLHNGAYDSLEDVVRHHLDPATSLQTYDGRSLPPELRATLQDAPITHQTILATLSPLLAEPQPLSNKQIRHLIAFLESLTQ